MSDGGPVIPDEPDDDERRRRGSIFDRWGKVAMLAAVVLLVVGVGAWALGSNGSDGQKVYVEPADAVGIDPFTTVGIAPTLVSSESPPTTKPPGLYGGSGDNGVCAPEKLVAFLESQPAKAAAWVAALNSDPTLSWSGGNHLKVTDIGAYVAELRSVYLTEDVQVTNHGFKNGQATPRQSLLKAGTAALVDKDGTLRVRCYCGNPLIPPDGGGDAATTTPDATTTMTAGATTTTGDIDWPDSTCADVGPVPSAATSITTAPVDFDGDGSGDVLRVYDLSGVWHVQAEIGNVVVDDDVLSGIGPTMAAIGGATVNNDPYEEAWVKVGSGSSTDIVAVFVYQGCDLQHLEVNGQGAEFPYGATVTGADGVQCFGFDIGIEVFSSTSSDGVTYTGTSTIYTIDLSSTPPALVPGATASQSETNPSPGFTSMSTFGCDSLSG